MESRNKLGQRTRQKKVAITVGITLFVIFFSISMYCCYVFKCFSHDNNLTAGEMNGADYISFLNALSSPSFSVAFDFWELVQMQIALWYIYAVIPIIVFLLCVSGRRNNDYEGIEKGSSHWEKKTSFKNFADRTGIPVGNDFYVTVKNPKGKYYATHNLNETVIGGSGAGKSFRKAKPDIIQMFGSYIVTDPKGELFRDTYKLLTKNGYKVRVLNLININLSNTYNPFVYMREEQDVLSVADLFIQNTSGDGERQDFWSASAKDLLVMIMLYLWKSQSEMKCFGRVIRLLNSIRYKDGKIDELCEIARCMKKHEIEHSADAATVLWAGFCGTPAETMGGVAKTLSTRLGLWSVADVDELTAEDEMDFDSVGIEKTAIFVIVPPARNTYKAVVNIFYSQLFERLMYIANFKCNGRLPQLVSCELDEFANIGKIPNFNETLAVVRSCNIRICIYLQGISQLKALYEKTWESILGNCSIFTFLGTNDLDTKKYVVERLGKTTVRTDTRSYSNSYRSGNSHSDNESFDSRDLCTVDELPLIIAPEGKSKKYGGHCIALIDEYRPFYLNKFDTLSHPLISEVGSSFPKDVHNNTNIEALYSPLKDERHGRHRTALDEALEKTRKDEENATAEAAAADQSEQEELAAVFNSNLGSNDNDIVIDEGSEEPDFEANEISESDFEVTAQENEAFFY